MAYAFNRIAFILTDLQDSANTPERDLMAKIQIF